MRLITIGSLTFVFLAGAHAWTNPELLPKSHEPELEAHELEALVQDLTSTHTAQKPSSASARWGRVLTDLRKALKTSPQLPEIAPTSTDSATQATESSTPLSQQVNQLREPSTSYDATGWDRVIDRQQVNQLREPSTSYDATGWDRVIDRHRTLGWDRIIDRHRDLNAGERVSSVEPLIGSSSKAKPEGEVAAPALKQMVVAEPEVSDCIQGTHEDSNPPQLEVSMVVEPIIGSGKAKPEVEVEAPALKQMAEDADNASSNKAPVEAGWFHATTESTNDWFKGQSEVTLDDPPSFGGRDADVDSFMSGKTPLVQIQTTQASDAQSGQSVGNDSSSFVNGIGQHMSVGKDHPEVQQIAEAEAALVRQVRQVKARLTAATQHKEGAELQQRLHEQQWCRVNCCGAARFGDMPQYFIDCSDCPCKRQNKTNKFTQE